LHGAPAPLLCSLHSLTSLNLAHNQLAALSDIGIEPTTTPCLPSLLSLDLSYNLLSSLPPHSLSQLASLTELSLEGNQLARLEESALAGVSSLAVLNLAHNQLATLSQHTLHTLPHLHTLRLDSNHLADINGLLTAQNQLRRLNVSDNRLQWFDYAFIPKSLEWIDLHGNQIEELGNYYELMDGFSLNTMDVSFNKLRKISATSFLTSLETIILNNNQIEEISANTFLQLASLKRVEVTHNMLASIQLAALAISQPGSVPEFHLGSNPFLCDCEMDYLLKLSKLAQSGHYPHIMDLDMITCTITNHKNSSAPHILQPLLETSANQFLCEYSAHCFALCQCCDFYACDCRMQCPEGCTCYHDSAWRHNLIQCSNRDHIHVPPLIPMDATQIYLDGNNFRSFVKPVFIGRTKVQSLFLNNSKIVAIGRKTFHGLNQLEILHLEHNWLEEINGGEFENLTGLQELYLNDNRIFHIDQAAFFNLSSLQVLFLHNNLLNVFPVWKLSILPSLTYLSVAQNPWTCDCSFVQQLKGYLSLISAMDTSQLECAGQGRMVNIEQNITCENSLAVPVSQTVVADHHHSLVIIIISVLGGIFLVAVTSSCLVLVFRNPLQVWLHSRYGVRIPGSTQSRKDWCYSAALCYSPADEVFLQQVFLPYLHSNTSGSYLVCGAGTAWSQVYLECARVVVLVSRAFLATEYSQVQLLLQNSRTVLVMLEQLSSQDLGPAPHLRHLLRTATTISWEDPVFWQKLRFHLPDTTQGDDTLYGSSARYTRTPTSRRHGVSNPLEHVADSSDCEHLYQVLDPVHEHGDEGDMLEVMLPGGELVAATLVRHQSGKVIPLVMGHNDQLLSEGHAV
jgi:Leucine-rich repeat (LRR) protein